MFSLVIATCPWISTSQILCDRETPKNCIKFLGLLSRLRDSLSLKSSSVTRLSSYSGTMDI